MNAAETIAAAIEKLEDQRDRASVGPWIFDGGEPAGYGVMADDGGVVHRAEIMDEDAELIVTLHRTINAQLALLRRDLDIRAKYTSEGLPVEAWESAVVRGGDLDLARAILGEVSS